MALDLTAVNIDFEVVRTNNCKILKVLDLSHWANSINDTAYLTILTPGLPSNQSVTFIFRKERLNIFNTNNLKLSDVTDYSLLGNLPDGIYTITLERCQSDPEAITRYFLQDCQIYCQITKKLISIDLICTPCRKELLEKIQDVLLFLEAAHAQADRCNPIKAMEYYQRAALILSRIQDSSSTNTPPCSTCNK